MSTIIYFGQFEDNLGILDIPVDKWQKALNGVKRRFSKFYQRTYYVHGYRNLRNITCGKHKSVYKFVPTDIQIHSNYLVYKINKQTIPEEEFPIIKKYHTDDIEDTIEIYVRGVSVRFIKNGQKHYIRIEYDDDKDVAWFISKITSSFL